MILSKPRSPVLRLHVMGWRHFRLDDVNFAAAGGAAAGARAGMCCRLLLTSLFKLFTQRFEWILQGINQTTEFKMPMMINDNRTSETL